MGRGDAARDCCAGARRGSRALPSPSREPRPPPCGAGMWHVAAGAATGRAGSDTSNAIRPGSAATSASGLPLGADGAEPNADNGDTADENQEPMNQGI